MSKALHIDEEELIKTLKPIQIPPQPELLMEIEAAGMDINRVAAVVGSDSSVAASVLKTVNSPFFGIASEVTDINQATVLLGLEYVKNIVNAILIQSAFSSNALEQLATFWQSTNDVAAAAAIVAKQCGCCSDSEAYLLGLFHNSGMPLMLMKHEDYMKTVGRSYAIAGENLTCLENHQYNANHAVVGYFISRTWNLPKKISLAIRDHHNRDILTKLTSSQDMDMAYLLATLKMAEHLTEENEALGSGRSDESFEWEEIRGTVMELLGLSEEDLANLQDAVNEQLGCGH